MMSPSTVASQYDEKHRSVLKKIEKDRKEAQEVRKIITRTAARKKKKTLQDNAHEKVMRKCKVRD